MDSLTRQIKLFFGVLAVVIVPQLVGAQLDGGPTIPTVAELAQGVPQPRASEPTEGSLALVTPLRIDPQFGSVNSAVPIAVPTNRAGLVPEVIVRYSSNAQTGAFGFGWDYEPAHIVRHTARGVPLDYSTAPIVFDDSAGFDLLFQGSIIWLDRCLDEPNCSKWGASSEKHWFDVTLNRATNEFSIRDKDGRIYKFGSSVFARTGISVDAFGTTFGWYLTGVKDLNGNTIDYIYGLPSDLDEPPIHQPSEQASENRRAYLRQIDYGGNIKPSVGLTHIFHVSFEYEPRPDIGIDYSGGFASQVVRRVREVRVWTDGHTVWETPTHRYEFAYSESPDTGVSLLTGVRLFPEGVANFPETSFEYEAPDYHFGAPESADFSPAPQFGTGTEGWFGPTRFRGFLDVNGDGLVDWLDPVIDGAYGLRAYENQLGAVFRDDSPPGQAWSGLLAEDFFLGNVIQAAQLRVVDLDGDLLADIARRPDDCVFYDGDCSCYSRTESGTCAWTFYKNLGDGFGAMRKSCVWPRESSGGLILDTVNETNSFDELS